MTYFDSFFRPRRLVYRAEPVPTPEDPADFWEPNAVNPDLGSSSQTDAIREQIHEAVEGTLSADRTSLFKLPFVNNTHVDNLTPAELLTLRSEGHHPGNEAYRNSLRVRAEDDIRNEERGDFLYRLRLRHFGTLSMNGWRPSVTLGPYLKNFHRIIGSPLGLPGTQKPREVLRNARAEKLKSNFSTLNPRIKAETKHAILRQMSSSSQHDFNALEATLSGDHLDSINRLLLENEIGQRKPELTALYRLCLLRPEALKEIERRVGQMRNPNTGSTADSRTLKTHTEAKQNIDKILTIFDELEGSYERRYHFYQELSSFQSSLKRATASKNPRAMAGYDKLINETHSKLSEVVGNMRSKTTECSLLVAELPDAVTDFNSTTTINVRTQGTDLLNYIRKTWLVAATGTPPAVPVPVTRTRKIDMNVTNLFTARTYLSAHISAAKNRGVGEPDPAKPTEAPKRMTAFELLFFTMQATMKNQKPNPVTDLGAVYTACRMAALQASNDMHADPYASANRHLYEETRFSKRRLLTRGAYRAGRWIRHHTTGRGAFYFHEVMERLSIYDQRLQPLHSLVKRDPAGITYEDIHSLHLDPKILPHLSSMLKQVLEGFNYDEHGVRQKVELDSRAAFQVQNLIGFIHRLLAERDAVAFTAEWKKRTAALGIEQRETMNNPVFMMRLLQDTQQQQERNAEESLRAMNESGLPWKELFVGPALARWVIKNKHNASMTPERRELLRRAEPLVRNRLRSHDTMESISATTREKVSDVFSYGKEAGKTALHYGTIIPWLLERRARRKAHPEEGKSGYFARRKAKKEAKREAKKARKAEAKLAQEKKLAERQKRPKGNVTGRWPLRVLRNIGTPGFLPHSGTASSHH